MRISLKCINENTLYDGRQKRITIDDLSDLGYLTRDPSQLSIKLSVNK